MCQILPNINLTLHLPYDRTIYRYYTFVPVLSILLTMFQYLFQEKKVLVYYKQKYSKLILKKKRPRKRKKTLLIIPKLIIFLLTISASFENKGHSPIDKIENDKTTYDYNFSRNDTLFQKYKLYALSELKYKKHETFCRYLLLLSGDVELNPGPDSCAVCKKTIPLRYQILCCKNCGSYVHKKCANISETRYKSIKLKVIGCFFDCHQCNYAKEMPFFEEECLDENSKNKHNLSRDNIIDFDLNDFNDFKVFAKSGLHFIHLNINSILPKIDELRLIAHKSRAAVIGITESKIDDSVLDGEIMIDGYIPIRSDTNRHGGGVICYIRHRISSSIEL